jgi:tryptophan synthase alpha chain
MKDSALTRISAVFEAARREDRTAFMPFITAGDPDLDGTLAAIRTLAKTGADLIEIGIPYSDPIADGPVIQASYTRALQKGITIDAIFKSLSTLDSKSLPPLIAMVSYAILMRRGVEKFIQDAARAGLSGFIVPDLPSSEAFDVFSLVRGAGLDLIQLIAPTTQQSRVDEILSNCSGFLYCLGVAGVTGERDKVADSLLAQLKGLRGKTKIPLAVGFGVSKPDHVATLRNVADGVIVGTAVVKRLDTSETGSLEASLKSLGEFTSEMSAACKA